MDKGRYLVTGDSGFIGSVVCSRLLRLGAEIYGVSRSPLPGNDPDEKPAWNHWSADLTCPTETNQLFGEIQPDYVLHLAGSVTGKRDIGQVGEALAGNLVASVNILFAAQNCNVKKVVMAGSGEEPAIDATCPIPASPYAAAKWAASGYARMFHALYGTSVAVARIFMVYGPAQRDLDKLVPYVCLSAGRGECPQLMSGNRQVDWIHVDDVADCLLQLTHKGPIDGSYVDIGSGKLVTTGIVARMICDISAKGVTPAFGAVPDRPMEQMNVADAKSTATLLGWSPKIDLDRGLADTYSWYEAAARGGQLG